MLLLFLFVDTNRVKQNGKQEHMISSCFGTRRLLSFKLRCNRYDDSPCGAYREVPCGIWVIFGFVRMEGSKDQPPG